MINAPPWWGSHNAKTEREAIKSWPATLRLLTLRTVPAVLWVVAVLVIYHCT